VADDFWQPISSPSTGRTSVPSALARQSYRDLTHEPLVSLLQTRDRENFGRILRVHQHLQGRELPPLLRHRYLLLADHESLVGISDAVDAMVSGSKG